MEKIEWNIRISAKSPWGLDGVAGTLFAFRLLGLVLFNKCCCLKAFRDSVKISRSVRPEYRNFVPRIKPPPLTTEACVLFGNLYNICIGFSYNTTILHLILMMMDLIQQNKNQTKETYVKKSICSIAHRHI